jgi:hypothetical protein
MSLIFADIFLTYSRSRSTNFFWRNGRNTGWGGTGSSKIKIDNLLGIELSDLSVKIKLTTGAQ